MNKTTNPLNKALTDTLLICLAAFTGTFSVVLIVIFKKLIHF